MDRVSTRDISVPWDLLALITHIAEEDRIEKILENQKIIKTPIVRNGKQATVGYPEPFCDEVTRYLNTDWTAQRMIGYLSHYQKLRLEDIADEVLAILSDRNQIMAKKSMEETNARWNEMMWDGFPFGEEDE